MKNTIGKTNTNRKLPPVFSWFNEQRRAQIFAWSLLIVMLFAVVLSSGCSKTEQASVVNTGTSGTVPAQMLNDEPIPNTPAARKQLREKGYYKASESAASKSK